MKTSGIIALSLVISCAAAVRADESGQVLFILSGSGSMGMHTDGTAKLDLAKKTVAELMEGFKRKPALKTGLRLYGHNEKSCDDTELAVPPADNSQEQISYKAGNLAPRGYSPLSKAMLAAEGDFDKTAPGPKEIVIISDGKDSCAGDPCAAAKTLKANGIVTKVHAIGFGSRPEELRKMECLAKPFAGVTVNYDNAAKLLFQYYQIPAPAQPAPVARENTTTTTVVTQTGAASSVTVITQTRSQETAPAPQPAQKTPLKKDARIAITVKDSAGNVVKTSLSGTDTNGDTAFKEQEGDYRLELEPGRWDFTITEAETGGKQTLSAMLESGATKEKEIIFTKSYLTVEPTDSAGRHFNAEIVILRSGTPEVVKTQTLTGPAKFILPAGTYDIAVNAPGHGRSRVIRGVLLSPNANEFRSAPFKAE